MYPTLCELCGLDIPAHCEGTSLAPLMNNPGLAWRQAAFSQYPRGAAIMGYAMRTDRYRYVEWRDTDSGDIKARELYDHATDAQENVNLAGRAGTALLDELSTQLRSGWEAAHKRDRQG